MGVGGACMGYDEIRSMSGWYASYWNAFLFDKNLLWKYKISMETFHVKQECIPVGCVPPASVAVSLGGLSIRGAVCLGRCLLGVCAQGGVCRGVSA